MMSEKDLSYGEAHLALSFGKECDKGLRPLYPRQSRSRNARTVLGACCPSLRTPFGPPAAGGGRLSESET